MRPEGVPGEVGGRRQRLPAQPVVPQRVIVNQSIGERRSIHSYGSRSADVSASFDAWLHEAVIGADAQGIVAVGGLQAVDHGGVDAVGLLRRRGHRLRS